MKRLLGTLCLAAALTLPLAVRADDAADRLATAKALVDKTVLKTLDLGFSGALDKTVSQMPADKAERVRTEGRAEFVKQRESLSDGLAKQYADKFSLKDLKHLQGIYDDPVYQKFQAMNADPKSEINILSQATVTRLLNMLTLAAAGDQKGGDQPLPGQRPMQMPPMPK